MYRNITYSLLTIYKSLFRPHYLDYGNVIYDQSNNYGLSEKVESFQYNTALAISGAITGTSKQKLSSIKWSSLAHLGIQPETSWNN